MKKEAFPSNRFQQQFGLPSERSRGKVRDHMHTWIQEFIQNSPFCVLATSDGNGRCDASPRGGKPGFVRVLSDKQLLIPDVAGNRLFQSFTNIESNNHVGLLFFIPGVNETARVNGKATIIAKNDLQNHGIELSVFHPDDNAKLSQGILLEVEEAYGHCPRALVFSNLWEPDLINNHIETSPISKRPSGV